MGWPRPIREVDTTTGRGSVNPASATAKRSTAVEIKALLGLNPEIVRTGQFLERFVSMVRRGAGENLEEWMEEARGRGIAEMKGFATKLGQDLAAILAGLKLPWSQGRTEGQVTNLKLIRRQIYGRGKFDLVRKRVLMAA
jgi:transposase